MVQDLYLAAGEQRFPFPARFEVELHFQKDETMGASLGALLKLMDRIGAKDYRDRPPRPKYMRRMTYMSICSEIRKEALNMYRAFLGPDLDRIVNT
jgi:hypothetical protein